MLLTVDIGNTTVAVAAFSGERLTFLRRLPSDTALDGPGWQRALEELLAGRRLFRPANGGQLGS